MVPPMSPPSLSRKSRSSPTLAAAYNLRQFTESRHRGEVVPPRDCGTVKSDTAKARDCRQRQVELRDAWAKLEEDERGLVAAEVKRNKRARELEILAKKEAREKAREKFELQQYVVAKAKRAEDERIAEQERLRIEENLREEARLKKEEEHREWLRRQPTPCEACSASGKCKHCEGKGYFLAMYLTPSVSSEARLEFGRKQHGCEFCEGFHYGILGEYQIGTGKCAECSGHGKIWPILDDDPPRASSSQSNGTRSTGMAGSG